MTARPFRVLFAGSEVVGFAKTGGLADVIGALPRALARRGHQTAIGAVARHLAEATYWILTKGEPYREPQSRPPQRTEGAIVHGGVSAPMP